MFCMTLFRLFSWRFSLSGFDVVSSFLVAIFVTKFDVVSSFLVAVFFIKFVFARMYMGRFFF